MRTKALIITAALGLASAASSMAQAVYSVNVVGYVNLTMRPGFNLVANQLKAGNNSLINVFPSGSVLPDSHVLTFANNNYTDDIWDGSDWLNNADGTASVTTVEPGKGFFFLNSEAVNTTVTLVGEVSTGNNLTVNLPTGFSLVSSIVPQQLSLTPANGFNAIPDMIYLSFNSAVQNYNSALLFDGADWTDNESGAVVPAPSVGVGQGFFILNPDAATSWVRSFNPNN